MHCYSELTLWKLSTALQSCASVKSRGSLIDRWNSQLKNAITLLIKLLFIGVILLLIALTRPWQSIPPQWNPWAPLAIDHPMTPVTRWKVSRLGDSPQLCLHILASAEDDDIDYLPLEDYTPVEGCPLKNVVRVSHTGIAFNAPFTVTCPLLVRWVMFEQQKLQDLAVEHLGSRVSNVSHYGSFACRNVYNRESGRLSQHATASALDVAGFTLEDGSTVNILRDWQNSATTIKADFLHEVHGAACHYFGTVLGPGYNQAHADHFHFDTSRFGVCR